MFDAISCSYINGDDSSYYHIKAGACLKSVFGGFQILTCSVSPVFLKRFDSLAPVSTSINSAFPSTSM